MARIAIKWGVGICVICLLTFGLWTHLVPAHAANTTYYVDSVNGSNDADGLSADTAWSDFTNVNALTFQSGDMLLLKRGSVWNQQLTINGQGSADNFIEIGPYGTGNRPIIQRSGDIADRAVRLNNASYVKVSSLEVSNGGAGIVLYYDHSYNNQSVYLDDIVAHDFQGIYRGNGSFSSNPAWQGYVSPDRVGFSYGIGITGVEDGANDQTRVLTDFRVTNSEIYNTGAGLALDWNDHKNVDNSMAGSNKFGNVLFDHLNLHDNTVPDVSVTSMFLQSVDGATFSNSTIDKGAFKAPFGTASMHLQLAKNITIDTVSINNTPDSGSVTDETGIDFEADTENVTINNAMFQNNAGTAIEFLANADVSSTPEARNVEVKNSTFINNNTISGSKPANQSQILVSDFTFSSNRPTGSIHDNFYQNPDGVGFYGGPGDTSGITLTNNNPVNN